MRTSSSHCLQSARLLSGLVLVMLSSGALAQPDQVPSAQPPAPILLHPQVAPAEAVEVGKDGNSPTLPFLAPSAGIATIAPIGGSQAAGATQAGESAALRSSLVLEQLLNGGKSVGALFDSGDLTPEVARYILSERVGAWGTVDGHWGVEVDSTRRDLALLVWREGGEALHKQAIAPRVLPRSLRLWLADSLGNVGDARCVPLCEGILSEMKAQGPVRGDELEALTFQTIERIGRFYRDQGQYEEGAKAWLRLPPLFADQGRWQPDATLEAARLYQAANNKAKAQELYAKVPAMGDGWLTILSRYDQAMPLMDAGKLKEAQAILSQPINATSRQVEGQIAQSAWLASLSYQQGHLDEAFRYGQLVIEAGKEGKFSSDSVHNLYDMGHDVYLRAGGWKTEPIQCDVKEIVLKTNSLHPDQPLYARFRIKTYGDQSVSATVDNPAIQVRVVPVDNWQKSEIEAYEEESEVIFCTKSNLLATTSLVISSDITKSRTSISLRIAH